ncbi:MAG TPA: amidophosphoribosyltransferase [Candidatus Paceibacterota bacterium]|nr:amidophosphoribosyltransferase [Verrucomicrobiota bacterium]HSA09200.1 amidophosphoribosyltransferase [Candidatus Paceibacterota bacterium]
MGGYFGVVSKDDCVNDLFYGTDYHSHLGTRRGGMAVHHGTGCTRFIHDISNAQFRSKFEHDVHKLKGRMGIGVISDTEDQPLIIGSHLGNYAIVTVGRIANLAELVKKAFGLRSAHFSEMSGAEVNPTELVALYINQGATFAEGIQIAQEAIAGSCSLLLLTDGGVYAARDKLGRTPMILGRKAGAYAATLESCAFPNLGYETVRELGPGEIVRLTPEGIEPVALPGTYCQICAFLWVYYGYPASTFEGINTEDCRYRCGAALARRDTVPVDVVAGIPDSGTGHAMGYAHQRGVPFRRPFVKYTPTWSRSFIPQDQSTRDLVARMKIIPIKELIHGQRMLFCEDSIVRGTQLTDTVRRIFDCGAKEVHMRPACPPLVFGCKFLNFSRSKSELDLAARRAIREMEGQDGPPPPEYVQPDSEKHRAMVERIRHRLGLTTLQYQQLDDLVTSIGLPREKLCTYCWHGRE